MNKPFYANIKNKIKIKKKKPQPKKKIENLQENVGLKLHFRPNGPYRHI
jgi:hypothetical protein